MKRIIYSKIGLPFSIFMAGFLPRILLMTHLYPVVQQRDEVCALGGAALFAGYDWSQVISTGHVYYGCGYTALFAPVLLFVKDPIWFYRIVIWSSAAIFGFCGIIAYKILGEEFDVNNKEYLFIASVLCSYLTCETGMISINEPMLILCIWISSWLLCRLCRQREKRAKVRDTVLYALVISYALTLHTRAQLLWVLTIFTHILYGLVYKSSLFSTPSLVVVGGLGFSLANTFIRYVQNMLWLSGKINNTGEVVSGTEVSSGLQQVKLLLQVKYWKTFLAIIVGQINTGIIYTGGLLAIILIITLSFIISRKLYLNFYIKKEHKSERPIKQDDSQEWGVHSCETDSKVQILFIWTTLGIVASIVYIAITWLNGTYYAMQGGFGGHGYSLRSITYLRYYFCYAGPFCLPGIALLENKRLDHKLTRNIIGIVGGLHLVWLTLIIPYVYQSDNAKDSFLALSFESWNDTAGLHTYLPGSVFLMGVFLIFMLCWKKKKIIVAVSIMCIFLTFESLFVIQNYNDKSLALFGTADWGQRLRMELEWQGTGEGIVFYTLERDMAYMYQVLNPAWQVVYGMPKKDAKEAVIFDCKYNPALAKECPWAELDDNEYVYVRGEHSQEVINTALWQADKELIQ